MNRSDIILSLAKLQPQLRVIDVTLAVTEILNAISATLSKGGRVEIRQFGSFSLNYRPQKFGRNPKTGDKVGIPAKNVPHFKPGKELRWRVNHSAIKTAMSKQVIGSPNTHLRTTLSNKIDCANENQA